jgi:glycosyltransferase involved in cell wall biosynthesis
MKRILFVDHTPFTGGAELVLAEHLRHLDRARYTPLVACTPTVPALLELYRSAGAEVHLSPMPRLKVRRASIVVGFLKAAWEFRRLVKRERIDLVVSNTSRAAYIASVALIGSGVPLIWWVRDFLYVPAVFRMLAWVPKKIVCVSESIRDFYGGSDDDRFSVIYVGSSLYRQLEVLPREEVREERQRWGFTTEDVVVGFMGRLVADKGIEDLIEAVAKAHARDPRIKLLVLGSGTGQEGDVDEKVRRHVAERGMSFVTFAGHQSNEALFYSVFDIFVLSTRTGEPFATSVVQAMMAGKPVIGTATGGTPEIIRHGETGLLVPPSSPDELARAIELLAGDPVLAESIAEAGCRLASADNREEQTTSRAEALYAELLRL